MENGDAYWLGRPASQLVVRQKRRIYFRTRGHEDEPQLLQAAALLHERRQAAQHPGHALQLQFDENQAHAAEAGQAARRLLAQLHAGAEHLHARHLQISRQADLPSRRWADSRGPGRRAGRAAATPTRPGIEV